MHLKGGAVLVRVNNLTILNKRISLKNLSFNFSSVGIYLVTGPNGSGKTSVIERIVYGRNDIEFENSKQQELYDKDRTFLFSYVPQNAVFPDMSVWEYVSKKNKSVQKADLLKLMEEFQISDIPLNKSIRLLSGGEKKKLSIICNFLKNTPYIFLDEPTNHLDDSSVIVLRNILEKMSKSKTIIVATHDSRLTLEDCTQIEIDNGVKITYSDSMPYRVANSTFPPDESVSAFLIALSLWKGKWEYIIVGLSILIMLALGAYNDMQLASNYSIPEQSKKDVVVAYDSEKVFGELNKVYVKGVKLNIAEDKIFTMIQYKDIPDIARSENINTILLYDNEYFQMVLQSIQNEELAIVSLPNDVQTYYSGLLGLPFGVEYLVSGRLPEDGKNEIAISKRLIEKYSLSIQMDTNPIGQEIILNETEYLIVGIMLYDVALVSYSSEQNYGIYQYSEDTYEEFMSRNLKHKKEFDYAYRDELELAIFYANTSEEKMVLDGLMQLFPANNYFSQIYALEWSKEFNKAVLSRLMLINFLIIGIVSFAFFLISKSHIQVCIQKIKDYKSYYFTNRILYLHYAIILSKNLIIYLGLVYINQMMSEFSFVSNTFIAINAIILFVPTMVYHLVKKSA